MTYQNMAASITRPSASHYHALLFVGVCNVERYVRSLIRWANLLHEMYGYPLENIRILVGTYGHPSWPTMPAGAEVTNNATLVDLDNALAAYATGSGDPHALAAEDSLFIFTFNHGGSDGTGSYICCDSFTTKYRPADFAARIADIHCRQIVYLAAQCYSGGFVDPFIGALPAGTRGAVLAGCRSDQVTWEAVFDKLCASAFNGRMVQNALDDNIDLGVTGEGVDVFLAPGYQTDRIDWGSAGVLSTRDAFNWVYDHYVNLVRPTYPWVDEVPLYRQQPWTESGNPVDLRLGEPDLVMQDSAADTGDVPSAGSPWQSPNVYADNTDQFPAASAFEYVPAHDNRFCIRTANRGTAPTDRVWRYLEVRGLGFTGGPVGPPRLDLATETAGGVTVSARLRPGRAHTQHQRILIGGDFGHGCVSAAAWCGADALDQPLWTIQGDNDQVQCNLSPATVSGSMPVGSGATNSNAGLLMWKIPVVASATGVFQLRAGKPEADFTVVARVEPKEQTLEKDQQGTFLLTLELPERVQDGAKGRLELALRQGRRTIGGVTLLLEVGTTEVIVSVCDETGRPVPEREAVLWQPGDPRRLTALTDLQGLASFSPLNPGFYFADTEGSDQPPVRVHAPAGEMTRVELSLRKR